MLAFLLPPASAAPADAPTISEAPRAAESAASLALSLHTFSAPPKRPEIKSAVIDAADAVSALLADPVFDGAKAPPLAYLKPPSRRPPGFPPESSGLLRDTAAQQWIIANRPRAYPALLANALLFADWSQILAAHHDNPPGLLRALLERTEDRWAHDSQVFLDFIERTPGFSQYRELASRASLDWTTLPDLIQRSLQKAGIGTELWATLSLRDRYNLARHAVYAPNGSLGVTAPPGTPENARQKQAALDAPKILLDEYEIGALREELEPSAAPTLALTKKETARLGASLFPAMLDELRGTPIGEEILAALDLSKKIFYIDARLPDLAICARNGLIIFSERLLADAERALGLPARALVNDPATLKQAAAVLAPIFVHEATHRRQNLQNAQKYPVAAPDHYHLSQELEAFTAEEIFRRQKIRSDPKKYGALYAITDTFVRHYFKNPGRFERAVEERYSDVPTLYRAAARTILRESKLDDLRTPDELPDIRGELARRRRLPAAERLKKHEEIRELRQRRDVLENPGFEAIRQALRMIVDYTQRIHRRYGEVQADTASTREARHTAWREN